jgi:ribosomal protein S18 acetylase RimI-like enzyme
MPHWRSNPLTRIQVSTSADVAAADALFREYTASLGVDLSFQGFAEELAALPGDYLPPRGALLLALAEDVALGCVGLRVLVWPQIAELKRLYVRPQARGRGVGRMLSEYALAAARDAGYERVRLDTLPTMIAAQRMYKSLGFQEIEPYRFNPVPGTRYMELVFPPQTTG